MSIYITGDTHGALERFTPKWMPNVDSWTEEDVLIVCGDFGFLLENNAYEAWKLDRLAELPFEICFLDGNHECFPKLETFEREIRHGGSVNRIRNNVFWLRRGELYTIQGYTFWVFGGGYSLDKPRRMEYERLSGVKVWFEEELPSDPEYKRGSATLEACSYKVDFILTHTAPASVIYRLLQTLPDQHEAELTGYLDWVYGKCRDHIKHWYFGHLHLDQAVTENVIACYTKVYQLPARANEEEEANA